MWHTSNCSLIGKHECDVRRLLHSMVIPLNFSNTVVVSYIIMKNMRWSQIRYTFSNVPIKYLKHKPGLYDVHEVAIQLYNLAVGLCHFYYVQYKCEISVWLEFCVKKSHTSKSHYSDLFVFINFARLLPFRRATYEERSKIDQSIFSTEFIWVALSITHHCREVESKNSCRERAFYTDNKGPQSHFFFPWTPPPGSVGGFPAYGSCG